MVPKGFVAFKRVFAARVNKNIPNDKRRKIKSIMARNGYAQVQFFIVPQLNMASGLMMLEKSDLQKYGDNFFSFERRNFRHNTEKITQKKSSAVPVKENAPKVLVRALFANLQYGTGWHHAPFSSLLQYLAHMK